MTQTAKNKMPAGRKRPPRLPALRLRRILVPLDFSGLARQALPTAVPLARAYKATINLVHVIPTSTLSAWRGIPGGGHYLALASHQFLDAARRRLMEMAAEFLPDDVRGSVMVRQGSAAVEAVAAAKGLKSDLIVLSTTGRSGLKRMVLGSTAESIVRHAPCPVLTVRRQTGAAAPQPTAFPERLPWRRLLAPVDFSPTSLAALRVAGALARKSGADLCLLNVIEPNPYPAGMEGALLVVPDADLERTAKARLPRLARRLVPGPVRVTPLVGHGRAADVITKAAQDHGADLIVLATHGHRGFNRLILGSVTEHVVRQARGPVLVLRPPPPGSKPV